MATILQKDEHVSFTQVGAEVSCVFIGDVSKTGVYTITNTVSGKQYVGSAASSFRSRWLTHIGQLRKGKHQNTRLQRAFNKYGESNFVFEVCVECSPEMCIEQEQLVLASRLRIGRELCYNICINAGSTRGTKASAETRMKLSLAFKGRKQSKEWVEKRTSGYRGRPLTAETRAKLSAANRGQKLTPEAIAKRTISRQGYVMSEATKAKIGEANRGRGKGLPGRKHSPETKEKLSRIRTNSVASSTQEQG